MSDNEKKSQSQNQGEQFSKMKKDRGLPQVKPNFPMPKVKPPKSSIQSSNSNNSSKKGK